jgi:branched-chain amino acid transport system permease protein
MNKSLRWVNAPLVNGTLGALLVVLVAAGFGFASYDAFVIQSVAIYAIAAYGLDVVAGFTGVLSLGHGAAFALGGYVVGILSAEHGQPVWVTLPLSMVGGAALGLAMGAPAIRLRGLSLAIISLGFALVAGDIALAETSITGGQSGIVSALPRLGFGAGAAVMGSEGLLILTIGCLLFAYLAHAGYRSSSLGRASLAMKDEPLGARALGIVIARVQMTAMITAASLGGLAGGLYVYANQLVSPEITALNLSFLFLIMVVLGGAGNQYGPLVGAAVIGALPIYLAQYTSIDTYIYAVLLLLVVLLRPRGIFGRTARIAKLPERATSEPEAASAVSLMEPDIAVGASVTKRRESVLECRDISRSFGGVRALKGVTLTVESGEVVAVVGPNGSGKTTLLNVLSGYYPPSGGSVMLGDTNVTGASVRKLALGGLGRTFQTPKTFDSLSPSEHIALAVARAHGSKSSQELKICYDLLASAGVDIFGDSRESRDLSHGQRRFLEVAMAISRRPKVLLLDEPATGLSSGESALLMLAIRAISACGIGVLVVEHHLELVREIADQTHVLNLGETLWSGPPGEMASSDAVRDVYLGR